MDEKRLRPFLGIVLDIGDMKYYAPLTSPRPKHIRMKNQIDFMKIDDGKLGAINFNNMIPVQTDCLYHVDIKIYSTDSKEDVAYKNLLSKQLSFCDKNRERIVKQAAQLYSLITSGKAWPSLVSRCCNYRIDEQMCLQYKNTFAVKESVQKNHDKSIEKHGQKHGVMARLNGAKKTVAERDANGTEKTEPTKNKNGPEL
jgi:protein AbiQ